MTPESGFALLLLLTGMVLAVAFKKLTRIAALAGGLVGLSVYIGAGVAGIAMLAVFFVLGTAATAFKRDWKEGAGIAQKGESRRTAGQVFANGGMAALLGLAAAVFPQEAAPLQTMLAAALASAAADTLSSELGVVYGRNFYSIRTLKKDQRGLDGVVSWEGTAIGIAGSIAIAIVHAIGFGFSENTVWIIIAGTIGNLSDSVLGATLERRDVLNNNAVNFFNTAIAAFVAFALVAIS